MSLRIRLSLLYTSLLGIVLLMFGGVVYGLVSVLLVEQTDRLLEGTAREVLPAVRITSQGDLTIAAFPTLNLAENVFIQLWSADGRLMASSAMVTRLDEPMDSNGLNASQTVLNNAEVRGVSLRVLDVPLMVNDRRVGVLEIGTSRKLIDTTQGYLLTVIVTGSLASMALAALAGWLSTGQVLSRLETVTQVATNITRADDLSQRIPTSSRYNDEIDQLIRAFNQTLSRLEKLFTIQRRFLADVSHELRTPLTVIKGNVGLLRKMGVTDEESLSSIEAEVDRLTRLVGNLLLLAQAESGKIPLDMRPVELDTVLMEVYQQLRILAGERLNVRITDIDQIEVVGDRDRLKQVLLNLGSNAIKYTPAGGQVSLSLSRVGEQARLIIADTGTGIPAQDLPHIFERFYRAEKSRTRARDGGGYGLGLSIAYWIVHNHGGRIDVDSKEGQGTSFCVWLPLTQDKIAPENVK